MALNVSAPKDTVVTPVTAVVAPVLAPVAQVVDPVTAPVSPPSGNTNHLSSLDKSLKVLITVVDSSTSTFDDTLDIYSGLVNAIIRTSHQS